jgi:tagatose 6-phosphate kinase
MILCIGTTPAVQRVMIFRKLVLDAVNRAATTLDGAAGKSINVAKVLQTLGERPVATGFLGGDRGEFLRATLKARGIEQDFVTVVARTRQCVTVIDEAGGTITELVEESPAVGAADCKKLMAIIRKHIQRCQAVVMSGTIAPGTPANLYAHCTRLARKAGALSVVDAHGAALLEALKAKPGLVKPNRSELAATVGRDLKDDAAVMRPIQELCKRGAQRVIITAGKDPALACDGQSFWRIVGPKVKAVNPIGSGDAFTAGLVWRLLGGDDFVEACRWASAVGAANALTPMAGEVNCEDVERLAQEAIAERV